MVLGMQFNKGPMKDLEYTTYTSNLCTESSHWGVVAMGCAAVTVSAALVRCIHVGQVLVLAIDVVVSAQGLF